MANPPPSRSRRPPRFQARSRWATSFRCRTRTWRRRRQRVTLRHLPHLLCRPRPSSQHPGLRVPCFRGSSVTLRHLQQRQPFQRSPSVPLRCRRCRALGSTLAAPSPTPRMSARCRPLLISSIGVSSSRPPCCSANTHTSPCLFTSIIFRISYFRSGLVASLRVVVRISQLVMR